MKLLYIFVFLGFNGNNDVYICSGEFRGLYGNNDGIKDNDLVSRDGVLINSNASMIDIHNQFGLTCKYIPMLYVICCMCGGGCVGGGCFKV